MKLLVKNYIVLAVMLVLCIGLSVGNYFCADNAQAITNLLCGKGLTFDGEDFAQATAESDALVRNICEEGIVMLKNDGGADGKGVLPLAADNRKLNLFGWSSTDNGFLFTGMGSGAAWVSADKRFTLKSGLEAQGFEINTQLLDKYTAYKNGREDKTESADPFMLIEPTREFYDDATMRYAREFSDTALIAINRNGGESVEMPTWQRKYKLSTDNSRTYLQLSTEEEALIELVTENFENVIMIINTTNPIELGFLDNDKIDAALNVGLPGQSGTNAIGRILKGEVNPSGRTVDTYAKDWRAAPSYANAFKNGESFHYTEGIYIGYKWYETAFVDKVKIDAYGKTFDYSTEEGYRDIVQYPFGYGLSYTDFSWTVNSAKVIAGDETADLAGAQVNVKSARIEVDVSVTNTGDVAGRDTVQLYCSAPYNGGKDKYGVGKNGIEKPALSLVDYEKTIVLYPADEVDAEHPGTQNMVLSFDLYDMASYDCYDANNDGIAAYELEAGKYSISLRNNAHELNECENSLIEFSLPDTLTYKLDPKTKRIVKNRFTGETAYGGVPIDGSTAGTPITYMSRSDFAGTFPIEATPDRAGGNVKKANSYIFDGYEGVDAPTQGVAGDLRIWTREDGSNAEIGDLEGTSGVALKLNEELVKALGSNYNAPEYNKLLDQITIAELFNLVESSGYANDAMVSIGKALNRDPDGPSGLTSDFGSVVDRSSWSCFPSETMLGATFSKSLAFQFGRAVGNEGATTGISGWYAPGVNLHRTQFNGRYFEYYSEDSVLSGNMAAYVIKGAASANMYCYLKHFALSEMGVNPRATNVWCNEQALREIYLRPFEIAVKDGEANAIMSAFNHIGGTWAGGNKALLTDILRTEWGFRGVVITDWSRGEDFMLPRQGIRAGNDIWLNPNDTVYNPLDRKDPTDIYLARNSAHNMLYTICNTYVRHTDYDPAEGEFAANVGIRTVDKVFPWWIPILVVVDVLIFGVAVFEIVWIFVKGRKRHLAVKAAEANGVVYVEPTRKNRAKKNKEQTAQLFEHSETVPDGSETVATDESAPSENENIVAESESTTVNNAQSSGVAAVDERDAEIASLKAEIERMRAEQSKFDEISAFVDDIKQERENKRIAAEKRKAAAKNKPKAPKAPSAKEQFDELRKEIESLKELMRNS